MRPVNHETAMIGASVIMYTARRTYRGVLVGSTVDRASVKCDDGKRREVPWTRTNRANRTEASIMQLSEEEAWTARRPKLTVARYPYGSRGMIIEVDVEHIGTDKFRADLEALRAWAEARPKETP